MNNPHLIALIASLMLAGTGYMLWLALRPRRLTCGFKPKLTR